MNQTINWSLESFRQRLIKWLTEQPNPRKAQIMTTRQKAVQPNGLLVFGRTAVWENNTENIAMVSQRRCQQLVWHVEIETTLRISSSNKDSFDLNRCRGILWHIFTSECTQGAPEVLWCTEACGSPCCIGLLWRITWWLAVYIMMGHMNRNSVLYKFCKTLSVIHVYNSGCSTYQQCMPCQAFVL